MQQQLIPCFRESMSFDKQDITSLTTTSVAHLCFPTTTYENNKDNEKQDSVRWRVTSREKGQDGLF